MLTTIQTVIRGLLQRRRVAREVDAELQFHLEMETESNIRQGMSPGEAQRRAALDLGDLVRTKEAIRDVRALSLESIVLDARYAIRGMRRRAGFTLLGVATLALGIGVNAASFAVAYGILVRPLPYLEPSRVVIINLLFADGGDLGFSPGVLQQWLPRLRTVQSAAGYYRREVTIRSGDRTTVVPAAVVTDRFFDVLGVSADAGLTRVDPDTRDVVVGRRVVRELLSSQTQQTIGTAVSVGEQAYTVSGIMPSDFSFPEDDIGVWMPSAVLRAGTKSEHSGYSKIVARLKPGVSIAQVQEDVRSIALELSPDSRQMVSVAVLGESVVVGLRKPLIAIALGALLVLLVACANVATLFIGRDVSRQRELAARMALGASRGRLLRSVLVESFLFAAMAAVAGTALGVAALKVLVASASGTIPGLHRVDVSPSVAVATVLLVCLVTVLCGVLPAWQATRTDFSPFLRTATGSRPRVRRLRSALVVAQIALSCVLLIGAGLLGRTVSVLMREDHGFQPDGALEAKVVLSDTVLFNGAERQMFLRELIERVRVMPGVRHAGFGSSLPPRTPPISIAVRLVGDARDETRFMKVVLVTPGYLRALGAAFVAGRDFEDGDDRTDAPVVVLSESVARFHFGDQDPIGRTTTRLPAILGATGAPRVIGVVRDIKYEGLDSPAGSAIYLPWAQRPLGSGYLIVRSSDDPLQLASAIRRVAQELDPTVPIPELQSVDAAMAQSIANRRVRALPAIGFGALALAVSLVGVLATLMALVAERRRDLAIRSALGASPGHLSRTIVWQGLALTATGLVVGLAVGGAAGRALASMLYRVSPFDAVTFAGAAFVIAGTAAVITLLAARRVRSIDPLLVLRSE